VSYGVGDDDDDDDELLPEHYGRVVSIPYFVSGLILGSEAGYSPYPYNRLDGVTEENPR